MIKASFTDNNYYARSKYCSERKFSRPKTRQRSSCTRRGFLNKGKEIYFYARSTQTSTAAVLRSFYELNRALEGTSEGLASGSDEHRRTQQGPNPDLRKGMRGTHGCGRAADVRRRSLVRVRLMQRPESVKTRGSTVAAAELGKRQEEEDDWGKT